MIRIKTIILKAEKPVSINTLTETALYYEKVLNEASDISDMEYKIMSIEKDYVVLPLQYGLTLQSIEEDIDGFKVYVKNLNDIIGQLEQS